MTDWPRAVFLDLDDTILAFDSVADESWLAVLHHYVDRFSFIGVNAIFHSIKLSAREFWQDPERHRMGRLDVGSARETIIGEAFRSHGIVDNELVSLLAHDYDIARTNAIHPIPGAIETVTEMRQSGVKLALLTNGEATSQREKIGRFHLDSLFDAIFIEGECGFGKPEERVYREALSKLGVRAEETWMVGDNWEWEVVAPQRIGLKGIWVNADGRQIPGNGLVQPFRVVKSLAELNPMIPSNSSIPGGLV